MGNQIKMSTSAKDESVNAVRDAVAVAVAVAVAIERSVFDIEKRVRHKAFGSLQGIVHEWSIMSIFRP